ncbi:MAG: hypothetical protein IIZ43_00820 [Eubacterium sp.]|nr:hypothetical protein [Eubacterium sp.]
MPRKTKHDPVIPHEYERLVMLQQQRIADWEAELKEMPEGYLFIEFRTPYVYFFQVVNDRKTSISSNTVLIYDLARKQYLKMRILEGEQALARMKRLGNKKQPSKKTQRTIRSLIERYSDAKLDILRITCSKEQYHWAIKPYAQNTTDWDGPVYESYSGRKFRSKSERDIANELELRGIPYRYEPKLRFKVDWMKGLEYTIEGKYKIYCPDFVILTAADTFIIWEHLGRVDLPEYREHNMEKISVYRQGGFCTEDQLILTFEKDLENLETIGRLIERRIMPYV